MRAHTLQEVAELLGTSRRTVRWWIDSGELRAVNLSADKASERPRLRVLDADLQAFLAARAVGGRSQQTSRRQTRRYKPRRRYV